MGETKDSGVEQEAANLRMQPDDLSRKRCSAETSGNKRMTFDLRTKLADSALRNCSTVTDCIREVSDSIANEIDEKNEIVALGLAVIKEARNLDALHSWYTEKLARSGTR